MAFLRDATSIVSLSFLFTCCGRINLAAELEDLNDRLILLAAEKVAAEQESYVLKEQVACMENLKEEMTALREVRFIFFFRCALWRCVFCIFVLLMSVFVVVGFATGGDQDIVPRIGIVASFQ